MGAVTRLGRRVLGPPLRQERPGRAREVAHVATRRLRMLPDFLILGTQKGGTTSLFLWLTRHPQVGRPIEKEIGYFDRHHGNGALWYRAHFPTAVAAQWRTARSGRFVTGEATPYSLMHPLAPARAAALVPHARLIALLRNPADRAFSFFQHRARLGLEPLPFEAALDAEEERLAGEVERMRSDPTYDSHHLREHAYLYGGRYADHLAAWLDHFPRDQLLVLRSEDLFTAPSEVFGGVLDFVGIDRVWEPHWYDAINAGAYDELPAATRRRLDAWFEPHNRRLRALLGPEFGWDAEDAPATTDH